MTLPDSPLKWRLAKKTKAKYMLKFKILFDVQEALLYWLSTLLIPR